MPRGRTGAAWGTPGPPGRTHRRSTIPVGRRAKHPDRGRLARPGNALRDVPNGHRGSVDVPENWEPCRSNHRPAWLGTPQCNRRLARAAALGRNRPSGWAGRAGRDDRTQARGWGGPIPTTGGLPRACGPPRRLTGRLASHTAGSFACPQTLPIIRPTNRRPTGLQVSIGHAMIGQKAAKVVVVTTRDGFSVGRSRSRESCRPRPSARPRRQSGRAWAMAGLFAR